MGRPTRPPAGCASHLLGDLDELPARLQGQFADGVEALLCHQKLLLAKANADVDVRTLCERSGRGFDRLLQGGEA